MSKRNKSSSGGLVYSTDGGRLCPQCQRSTTDCVCGSNRPAYVGDGIVRLRRESKGRGGKAVTIIDGLDLDPNAMKDLAKRLKKRCGVGGSVKGQTIEIQGEQREVIKTELEKLGHTVKLAGG